MDNKNYTKLLSLCALLLSTAVHADICPSSHYIYIEDNHYKVVGDGGVWVSRNTIGTKPEQENEHRSVGFAGTSGRVTHIDDEYYIQGLMCTYKNSRPDNGSLYIIFEAPITKYRIVNFEQWNFIWDDAYGCRGFPEYCQFEPIS